MSEKIIKLNEDTVKTELKEGVPKVTALKEIDQAERQVAFRIARYSPKFCVKHKKR